MNQFGSMIYHPKNWWFAIPKIRRPHSPEVWDWQGDSARNSKEVLERPPNSMEVFDLRSGQVNIWVPKGPEMRIFSEQNIQLRGQKVIANNTGQPRHCFSCRRACSSSSSSSASASASFSSSSSSSSSSGSSSSSSASSSSSSSSSSSGSSSSSSSSSGSSSASSSASASASVSVSYYFQSTKLCENLLWFNHGLPDPLDVGRPGSETIHHCSV